jgi:hypothetical protein
MFLGIIVIRLKKLKNRKPMYNSKLSGKPGILLRCQGISLAHAG